MGTDPMTVVQRLRARIASGLADDPPDGDLLGVFAATRDEAAFSALLTRHGPMVLGVCRRILGNAADAEDAFQATFLVLARRAGEVDGLRSVSGWLYGVAVRVAQKARIREARRRARERGATSVCPTDPFDDVEWQDVRPVLDEELDRLGGKYRDPIVLCCLEGRSREEAARLLGWPEGTVSGRLARGKELLRERLARRGVVCSAAGLATLLATNTVAAVPAELSRAALALATDGGAPAAVAALAAGGGAGRWAWRVGAVTAAGVVLAAGGWAWVSRWGPAANDDRQPPTEVQKPASPIRLVHGSPVLAVAVSPRGLVATAGTGAEVRIWKADGTLAARCPVADGGGAVGFAPDGRSLALAGFDGNVRVCDAATGTPRHTLSDHGEATHAIAFTPDGTVLASAGADGRVRLWDAATGRHLRDATGHRGRVWGLSFSPDGREVASAGGDQTVRIWDVATGRELRRFPGLRGGAYAVEFHPAGHTLAVAADNTVLLLDSRTGRERARVGVPRTSVTWFAFSPDGRCLAYRDGKAVRLWEVASGTDRLTIDLSAEPTGLAFSPDGRSLVIAADDGATVWDLRRLVRPLPATDPTTLWAHLAGADAGLALRAVETLAGDPDRAVPLLRDKLHAMPDLPARIDDLVKRLGSESFDARERASRDLEAVGADAVPALRRAVTVSPSAEVRTRATRLLARIPDPESAEATRPSMTHVRAIEVLERAGTSEARGVLAALAGREMDSPLKRDAAAALARLRRTPP